MEDIVMWSIYGIIAAIIISLIMLFRPRWVVVPAHQAHIVVSRSRRTVYCSRTGHKSGYWFIPFLNQRTVLPLENIKLVIEDVSLRDKDLAKFLADVRCWLSIDNPDLAAEKLGRVDTSESERGFPAIERDVKDLIEAITRNSSMKMDVFTTMKERERFSQNVENEVAPILQKEWGIKMADLEVIHFEDDEGYTVIKDLQARQAMVINAETRKQVAMKEKEASMSEAIANKEKQVQNATSEEEYRKRQITKDEEVGKREQEKLQKIAEAQAAANEKAVEARRKLEVGNADVDKQALIKKAEGTAGARKAVAEGEAEYTKLTGFAQAEVTKLTLFAEAEGTEKKALALKQYTDAGLSLEVIKANIAINEAKFKAWGEGLRVAKINIITGPEGNVLGVPVGGQTGAEIGQMLLAMAEQGIDVKDIINKIPIPETLKIAIAAKAGVEVVKTAEKQKQPEKKGKQDD